MQCAPRHTSFSDFQKQNYLLIFIVFAFHEIGTETGLTQILPFTVKLKLAETLPTLFFATHSYHPSSVMFADWIVLTPSTTSGT